MVYAQKRIFDVHMLRGMTQQWAVNSTPPALGAIGATSGRVQAPVRAHPRDSGGLRELVFGS